MDKKFTSKAPRLPSCHGHLCGSFSAFSMMSSTPSPPPWRPFGLSHVTCPCSILHGRMCVYIRRVHLRSSAL
ncbi:hypothetical protein NC651_012356 [Populus alba x Populus x berolinensis]|nr:hypothetical protein NC651_012352 [Populus alba x Populus x berolinensis]KAJ6918102.1 hypothetical protein NC651_012356 [Populus alba x Populus x berolinensis]